jgi:hypothetical protein
VTRPDSNFGGTSGTGLPEADLDFSCKGDSVTNPEVVVDVKQDTLPEDEEEAAAAQIGFEEFEDEAWIRIPVTGVEQWINKDGPADITRTAKVHFPYEWGDHTILQYINGFSSQNNLADQADPYDECRIFFYDRDIDQWVQAHYGYVGGIGPAAESTGVGKFWVYDPADLMKGIQVSKSFTEPSVASVIDFVLSGTDDQGDVVGLERRSVFDGPIGHTIINEAELPQAKQENITGQGVGDISIGGMRIQDSAVVGDALEQALDTVARAATEGQKRFQLNRHNMVDVMDWFVNLLDGRWWFEPGPEAPTLVIDASAYKEGAEKGQFDRRYFVDRAAVDDWSDVQIQLRKQTYIKQAFDVLQDNILEQAERIGETVETEFNGEEVTLDFSAKQLIENGDVEADFLPPHNYNIFAQVETLNNSALADIKPFNTLYLYGESTTLRSKLDNYRDSAAPGIETAEFPWVKVTYPPLIERAGGFEYSAQPIESDKLFLVQAEHQARKEFRKHLAEQTEGEITLLGEPHILPYDYVVSLPTCNGTYENVNATPITWEVNGVKHTRKAGERHKTKLGVSMTLEESLMRVESEYKEA